MKPLSATVAEPRDNALAHKLRANGVRNALRIVLECRHRHNGVIPVSLGLALQEQESGGLNIFGADENAPFAHLPVTKARVLKLVNLVHAGGISNGVGPMQLTFIGFIEEANREAARGSPRSTSRRASASSPATSSSTACPAGWRHSTPAARSRARARRTHSTSSSSKTTSTN